MKKDIITREIVADDGVPFAFSSRDESLIPYSAIRSSGVYVKDSTSYQAIDASLNVIFTFLDKWYDDDMPHDHASGLIGIATGPCGSVNRLMESEEQKMEEQQEEVLPYNIFSFEE
jgi:hypothetical protein